MADDEKLHPREVFSIFKEICAIPHGSGNERALSEYLLDFARKRGLEASRDGENNVLIRKPAPAGCGAAEPVILQAHIDMVCVKEEGSAFDFATQPIETRIDGDWLRAAGTTLGADNAIGMAYMLALLDADTPRPPLELVFTTREEVGMNGALAFDVSQLKGSRLVNLDTEDEGTFYASCCGGATVELALPLELSPPEGDGFSAYRLAVAGLLGGHSGAEMHKQRGNALRLLGRVLADLRERFDLRLAGFEGGVVSNSIPASASAPLQIPKDKAGEIVGAIAAWREIFVEELKGSDERPILELAPAEAPKRIYAGKTADSLLALMNLLPNGVEAMDRSFGDPNLVETSSNLAKARTEGTSLLITVSVRSALPSKIDMLVRRIRLVAGLYGAGLEVKAGYPGWRYNPESRLRAVFGRAFAILNDGREAIVSGVHGGLECGVFDDKYRNAGRSIDIISFGPDIRGAHSPGERASVSSTANVWELIKEGLRLLCE